MKTDTKKIFLKGESVMGGTEYNFSNMTASKLENNKNIHVSLTLLAKGSGQLIAECKKDIISSRIVGIKRVLQDLGSNTPKVVVEVEVSSKDFTRIIQSLGNGYILSGYSVELRMKISSDLKPNDINYLDNIDSRWKELQNYDQVDQRDKINQRDAGELNPYCKLRISTENTGINIKDTLNTLKFDILISKKNRKARPIKIVVDVNSVYYRGEYIGKAIRMGFGSLGLLVELTLDDCDTTKLLHQTLIEECTHTEDIAEHTSSSPITFIDKNNLASIFRSNKVSFKFKEEKDLQKPDGMANPCKVKNPTPAKSKKIENENSIDKKYIYLVAACAVCMDGLDYQNFLINNIEDLDVTIGVRNISIKGAKIKRLFKLKSDLSKDVINEAVIEFEISNSEYISIMKALGDSFVISGILRTKTNPRIIGLLRSLNLGEGADINSEIKSTKPKEDNKDKNTNFAVIKKIPFNKDIANYKALIDGLNTYPENYDFIVKHTKAPEVSGLLHDITFDKTTNTTYLEISFANETIASMAVNLLANSYYILPAAGNKFPAAIRSKLKSKAVESTDDTRSRLAESARVSLSTYMERSFLASNTRKEMVETIINSFSHIENNDRAFNLKRHILATLKKDPRLSPSTRASLDNATTKLQGSNLQENIPGEIEFKVGLPIMSLKHHALFSSNKKENYLATIEVMDASFKCPITDLSVCKNIDGSINKIMITALIPVNALKAIKIYGLNLKDKAGIAVGKIIEKSTGRYVASIHIPSQEDSLYYKRHKSLKDFDGDIIRYNIPKNNLQNPVVPQGLNPENKTFKNVCETKDDCKLDVDKSAEPVAEQTKDSEFKYKTILYPEVDFERLKDAKKYADAVNKGIEDTLKLTDKVSSLPILTNDNFKNFKAYIKKAIIGTCHHAGFESKSVYSVALCILVPNEIVEKLKEDNISLEDVIQHTLENIETCKKGKLKKIVMSTHAIPKESSFDKINKYLKYNNSIWRQRDGDTVKTYKILYTYVKSFKIKALAIEIE